ncbi:MAG: Gfo/Idh/MocA family oxidoreductase [Chloroflexota bacterium]|nr:Gfo/Idh/MocA family oxidoreductase [Chloroflexota bacterium]
MAAPIAVGFIGFGRQAENHAKSMAAHPEQYRLGSVCDITASRRDVARDAYGMRATDNPKDLLAQDIELVFITSHSSAHHEHTLAALEAKKHCMVEKPFAMNGREATDMVEAARANAVILSCFHNRRWDDDVRKVRRAVKEGRLGDLFLVENRSAGAKPAVTFGVPDFKQEWRITSQMGGGTIFDFGPHWFDQVLSLLPGRSVRSVYADVRHFKWGDADDYFDVRLAFDDGCRATVSKCDVAYVSWPKWIVFGTKGGIRYEQNTCTLVTESGEGVVEDGEPRVDLFQNLYRAVREGAPLAVTGEEARRNILLIDAAFESARLGRSIEVDI